MASHRLILPRYRRHLSLATERKTESDTVVTLRFDSSSSDASDFWARRRGHPCSITKTVCHRNHADQATQHKAGPRATRGMPTRRTALRKAFRGLAIGSRFQKAQSAQSARYLSEPPQWAAGSPCRASFVVVALAASYRWSARTCPDDLA